MAGDNGALAWLTYWLVHEMVNWMGTPKMTLELVAKRGQLMVLKRGQKGVS
jgi:hypothetical protein